MTAPRYPTVHVKLTGEDGNVYSILGRVIQALSDAGVPQEQIDAFWVEATESDYNHALQTCMRWVDVN
jgi:hypothetical protein